MNCNHDHVSTLGIWKIERAMKMLCDTFAVVADAKGEGKPANEFLADIAMHIGFVMEMLTSEEEVAEMFSRPEMINLHEEVWGDLREDYEFKYREAF